MKEREFEAESMRTSDRLTFERSSDKETFDEIGRMKEVRRRSSKSEDDAITD